MKRTRWAICAGVFILAGVGAWIAVKTCWRPAEEEAPSPPPAAEVERVRQPAVAGMFYPADPRTLGEQIDGFLAGTRAARLEHLRALISPHAGYRFSGDTAAEGYAQLTGRGIRTVVVMAPSHCAAFEGASIPDVDAYETPLGRIQLSPQAKELAKIPPFVSNPPCRVRRPDWWRSAPKDLPAFGADTPHTWEHSLEVQLPFLQKTLKDFTLIPIVFGKVDPQTVARALVEHVLDDQTLFVASSDLSHYYPYIVARRLDESCTETIVAGEIEDRSRHEACGMLPNLALMHIARDRGWEAKLLKYCNSGDTAGDKSRVVGYAAVAFVESSGENRPPQTQTAADARNYSTEERSRLLKLARTTLTEVVTKGKLPEVDPDQFAGKLTEHKGCFVTLTVGGRLRGCIGHLLPKEPLYQAVMDNVRSAALLDKRFPSVKPEELASIEVEISVLTVPRRLEHRSPLDLLTRLRPRIDGVLLRVGQKQSTYLPQVWEQFPNKMAFMGKLSEKAGLPAAGWQTRGAGVWTYHAEAFKESEMQAHGER